MSRSHPSADPNPLVRDVYDELGALLARGDDVFVEEGPDHLREAVRREGFFENVEPDPAPPDSYTREKVIGDPDGHVVRFMEWPAGYTLVPHEHHGRPCFEVLVDGHLVLTDLDRIDLGDDRYTFEVIDSSVTHPGEAAVVDPRRNEIHSVYSPVRSRSLHVYPTDNWTAFGYVRDESREGDVYRREEFELRRD